MNNCNSLILMVGNGIDCYLKVVHPMDWRLEIGDWAPKVFKLRKNHFDTSFTAVKTAGLRFSLFFL